MMSSTEIFSSAATGACSSAVRAARQTSLRIFSALPSTSADLGHVGEGCGCRLRGTARDDDPRPRTLPLELADGLARLAHRLRRHRAGVDHDRIGQLGRCRLATDHFRLVGIEPAAEGDDINRHCLAHA